MNTKQPLIGLAVAFGIASHTIQADQLTMLTDFGLPKSSFPSQFVDVNGMLFFVTEGGEVWRSDGTAAGTLRVSKNLAHLNSLVSVNGHLFFTSYDDAYREGKLWRSDGTEAGTRVVKVIPGSDGSDGSQPSSLVDVNGTLFFTVDDGHGVALWKSDGTEPGTVMVKDPYPGLQGPLFPSDLLNINGTLLFFAGGPNAYGLWKSDGTGAGTVQVNTVAGDNGSLVNVNGMLFFANNRDTLWKSDGTAAGTVLVKTILRGAHSSGISKLVDVNGTVFFRAEDGRGGRGLWKNDGTEAGTVLVKEHIFRWNEDYPEPWPITINGTLFFTGLGGLWKSDGTEAGTVLIKEIDLSSSVNLNGTLFFIGRNDNGSYGLWKSDGTTEETELLANNVDQIVPDFAIYGGGLANVNGSLFFATFDAAKGTQLMKSDGTAAGTVVVKDLYRADGSRPSELLDVNGTLFFAANDLEHGNELWKTDGTVAGAALVKHIDGNLCCNPELVNVSGTVFFAASDRVSGRELWKSDGTPEGTAVVKDINPGKLVNVNGTLFIAVYSDDLRRSELWKSDGTAAGTVLVKDIPPDFGLFELGNANGTLLFWAGLGQSGHELWKSDGTAAGTVPVKSFFPFTYSDASHLLSANGALFFTADDGEHGVQLWKYVPDPVANGRPVLKIARNGGQLVLSWPASFSGLSLESTTNLSSSLNWSQAPGTPTIVSGDYTVSASLTSTNTFYRLKR